jgi:hypothetical protein
MIYKFSLQHTSKLCAFNELKVDIFLTYTCNASNICKNIFGFAVNEQEMQTRYKNMGRLVWKVMCTAAGFSMNVTSIECSAKKIY